jgi:transposase-like protein
VGNPKKIEVRQRAERLYVIDGIVILATLAKRVNTSRTTLAKWRDEYEWEKKRAENVAQPEEISDRLKKILHLVIDEMDEMVKNKQILALKPKVADLEKIVRSLARIDALFDNKGAMIKFCYNFVDFVASLPKERSLLTHLKRVLPLYIEHVENNG